MKRNSGFTLIELMIVVAIIAIIAAIAVPNLMRSRMSANESSAAGAMRTIATGQVAYQTAGFSDADSDGVGDYGTLAQLAAPPTGQPFIDVALGTTGRKHGYTFTCTPVAGSATAPPTYTCTAIPQVIGRTGVKAYFVDESSVIRATSDGSTPNASSPPL